MARPTVQHKGFLIPNAGDVSNPRMSEPDRVDFNTLGNARYGVVEGCEVTVSGTSATNTAGMVVVNGALVTVLGGQSVDLGDSGIQDRLDIIGVNTNGRLKIVPGTPAQSPVFPDPGTDITTLAAVFCPAGGGSLVNNIIDKRMFLSNALLTKIASAASLVVNRNGSGDLFRIDGGGTTVWSDDTIIQRTGPATLRISENIDLDGNLAAGLAVTAKSLTATEKVSGSNLRQGVGTPSGSANPGDIYQGSSGRIYVYTAGAWQEIATTASAVPMGTVITSLQVPSVMRDLGWLPLDGTTSITEDTVPSLFTLPALAQYIPGDSPVAPHRTMVLPDARRRVLMGDFTSAGNRGGQANIVISLANLPVHKHNVVVTPGGGVTPVGSVGLSGGHGHVTRQGDGRHPHEISDPGHKHYWAEAPAGGAFVALSWDGQNKIDAYFNDRSHTFSVESADWTGGAFTGIRVGADGSEHVHTVEPVLDHNHGLFLNPIPPHPHTISETSVGSNTPIAYQPEYLSVYVYIRI